MVSRPLIAAGALNVKLSSNDFALLLFGGTCTLHDISGPSDGDLTECGERISYELFLCLAIISRELLVMESVEEQIGFAQQNFSHSIVHASQSSR